MTLDRLELSPTGEPLQIDERALHGPVGEIVRTVGPDSEADPVALVVDFLTSFGNAVGPGPFLMADSARHTPRLFTVLVGRTAKARKGVSRANIQRVMRHADPLWAEECCLSGLASGEGIIKTFETPDDGSGRDRRGLFVEEEFGRLIVAANREGSTLSPIVRNAWDGAPLAVRTRVDPLVAKNAHLSVLGHTTIDELHLRMRKVEIANGFVNRHLWVCVRRSKRRPSGGTLLEETFERLGSIVRTALAKARSVQEMRRSPEAEQLWEWIYMAVDEDLRGPVDHALARLEPQLLRVAMTYALVDGSRTIEVDHLEAACAVMDYVCASVQYVFGGRTGNPNANRILERLARTERITRTGLRQEFSNHITAADLSAALDLLLDSGLITVTKEPTKGRSAEVVELAPKAQQAQKLPGLTNGHGLIRHCELFAQESRRSERGTEPQPLPAVTIMRHPPSKPTGTAHTEARQHLEPE